LNYTRALLIALDVIKCDDMVITPLFLICSHISHLN